MKRCSRRPRRSCPSRGRTGSCYSHERIAAWRERGDARLVGRFTAEMGGHGTHLVDTADGPVVGRAVVATGAIRDEGTSFHHAPPSPAIDVDPDVVDALVGLLDERSVPHVTGLTWTTDAPFRETRASVEARREQGRLAVEAEAAALLAAARFRGVRLGLLLYAADDLSGPAWASRNWTTGDARGELLGLAIGATARIHPTQCPVMNRPRGPRRPARRGSRR